MAELWFLPLIFQVIVFIALFALFYHCFGFIIALGLSVGVIYTSIISMQDQ